MSILLPDTILDLAIHGLSRAADAAMISSWKDGAIAWLRETNPWRELLERKELVHCVRLSWIAAADQVLSKALGELKNEEYAEDSMQYLGDARSELEILRARTLDVDAPFHHCPIDVHAQLVLRCAPELSDAGLSQSGRARLSEEFIDVIEWITNRGYVIMPKMARHAIERELRRRDESGIAHGFDELVIQSFAADQAKSRREFPGGGWHGIEVDVAINRLCYWLLEAVQHVETNIPARPQRLVADLIRELDRRGFLARAESRGASAAFVEAIARRLRADEVDDAPQAEQEIENAIDRLGDIKKRADDATTAHPRVTQVLQRVMASNLAGDLDAGLAVLIQEIESLRDDMSLEYEALRHARFEFLSAQASQHELRGDLFAAAQCVSRRWVDRPRSDDGCEGRSLSEILDGPKYDFVEQRAEQGIMRKSRTALGFAIQLALIEISNASPPAWVAGALGSLARMVFLAGLLEDETPLLALGLELHGEVINRVPFEYHPLGWAIAHGIKGEYLISLADRRRDIPTARDAISHLEQAMAVISEKGSSAELAQFEAALSRARQVLASLPDS